MRRPEHRRRRGQRGFALLIVLGALPMLAMLGTIAQLSGHSEVVLAGNLRGAATLQAAADGAIRAGIFHLVEGSWAADGSVHVVRVGDRDIDVRIQSEASLINPNVAPQALLQALLVTLDVEPIQAQALAACIFDWRSPGDDPSPHGAKTPAYKAAGKAYAPPGVGFQRLDELRLVLGMTDGIYRRILPYMSLYTGAGIDLIHADPVVRIAFQLAGKNGGYLKPMAPDNFLVARLYARASDAAGSSPVRQATVRIFGLDDRDESYRVEEWGTREG